MTAIEALRRIERWVAAHHPDRTPVLNPGVSAQAIAEAEAALGFALPNELRTLYRAYDGQETYHSPSPCLYQSAHLQPLATMVEDWRSLCDDFRDSGDPESPFYFDGGVEADRGVKPVWWSKAWLPLFEYASGDRICYDLEPAQGGRVGQMVAFWHDGAERPILAPSLAALFTEVADGLEQGKLNFYDYGALMTPEEWARFKGD
jgi:cell wall assembly regulator SMI1